ncbi:chaperonin 10-like protein [Infundibulicybe gibba]|nr:chaperonin 10-like protein [Infundibulicybe gibba]
MPATHTAIALTSKGVLIKVAYTSLMAVDLYAVDLGLTVVDYPAGLGFNIAGVVHQLGAEVKDLAVGDRVAAVSFKGMESKGLQEYALAPQHKVAKIPASTSLPEAATIPDNFITAFYTLFNQLSLPVPSFPVTTPPPRASEPILVYGGSTTSGQYMIQLLHRAGYTHTITTASPPHHEYLRTLGGKGVQLAVDTVAAEETLKVVAGAVADDARVAILMPIKEGNALAGGNLILGLPEDRNPFAKGVRLISVRTFYYDQDAYMKENLMAIVLPALLEQGLVEPNRVRLMEEGPLMSRAEAALDLLRNNRVSGEKLVLKVGGV